MKFVDQFLNKFTMYFVVLNGLRIIVAWSIVLSVLGLVSYKPLNLIFSFCFLVGICYLANKLFALIFKVQENKESYTITALILYLILIPVNSIDTAFIFVVAGTSAMASKYLIAPNKRHIFNPAAFSLVVIGFLGSPQGEWWVGSKLMFPVVLIIGLLIVRKVRKFQMFAAFIFVSFVMLAVNSFTEKIDFWALLPQVILFGPLIFLGTVMLVEPLTTPPTKKLQMAYAAVVGFLFGFHFQLGPIFSTAELALVLGNIFSYLVSFRYRLILTFKEKAQLAPNIYKFIFSPNKKFAYLPGQYMEWTLGHKKSDLRGVRRYFTVASAPSEDNLEIAVRIDSKKGSSFKRALIGLKPGDKIYAGQLSGDFVLPKSQGKYVFIAGGIGITPFRSIVKNAVDKKTRLDAVLFYSCSEEGEFVYQDLFESAEKIGLKAIFACSHPKPGWKGFTGRINQDLIKQEAPDYKDRIYYLSGPNAMVESYKKLLRKLGIRTDKIVTDYFPGY